MSGVHHLVNTAWVWLHLIEDAKAVPNPTVLGLSELSLEVGLQVASVDVEAKRTQLVV